MALPRPPALPLLPWTPASAHSAGPSSRPTSPPTATPRQPPFPSPLP
jgi:hypothetical protein